MKASRRAFSLLAGSAIALVTGRLAQAAFAIFQTSNTQPIIPASRLTTWQPGVTYNTVPGLGSPGIPNYTNIHATLSPIGGGSDDTAQINSAITSAGAAASSSSPQVVLLNAGVYNINGNGIFHDQSYVVLRGSGLPAAMATGGNLANDTASALNYVSGTWLIKQDRNSFSGPILSLGRQTDWPALIDSVNLTADTVPGTNTCSVSSASGLSVGQVIVIDHVTDVDPNVSYNNQTNLSGYFIGSLSGTSLTFTSAINSPQGNVDTTFNGTFSGTNLTVNSSAATGYVANAFGLQQGNLGFSVFDASNNYYGYITGGSSPTFTMSQSNSSATRNLMLGGQTPQVGYPIFDQYFSTFYGFISSGTFPNFTMNQSNPTLTGVTLTAGGGQRRQNSRQDRAVGQMMRITNISGTTLTFETVFHYAFKTAYAAQLSIIDPGFNAIITGSGVESLGMFGGTASNFQGGCTSYCWMKGCESYWSNGVGVSWLGGYRCEVRDTLMHETPNPNPGGGGYLHEWSTWSSDCLTENCIMWMGNKVIVMRGAGGGNVAGYNYMDDSLGGGYPDSPEAGLNSAHLTCMAYCLFEGNYCDNYEADSFWGSSFCITVHRNWLSGIRGCSPAGPSASAGFAPTNTNTTALRAYKSGNTPYGDYNGRRCVDVQAGSFNHNFTGNVLGFNGETLLTISISGYSSTQTTWVYEELDSVISATANVILWNLGALQQNGFQWVNTTYQTQLRSGNWDWQSMSQQWHGIGGSNEYGGNLTPPYPSIPNSYYLPGGGSASAPSFFTSRYTTNRFPWVDPTTGNTGPLTAQTSGGLPARQRFNNNTPNVL